MDRDSFRSTISSLLAEKGVSLQKGQKPEPPKNPTGQHPLRSEATERVIEWGDHLYVIRENRLVRVGDIHRASADAMRTKTTAPRRLEAVSAKQQPAHLKPKTSSRNESNLRSQQGVNRLLSRLPARIQCAVCAVTVELSKFPEHVSVHKVQIQGGGQESEDPNRLFQVLRFDAELGHIGACLVCGQPVTLELIRRHWFKVHGAEISGEINYPQWRVDRHQRYGTMANISNWMEVSTTSEGTAFHGIGVVRRDWNGQFGSLSDFDSSED